MMNYQARTLARKPSSSNQKFFKLTAEQASLRLRQAIHAHAQDAIQWGETDRSTPALVLAIKASAGVGKSQAVLEVLATEEWKSRRVLYLVPSIELAEELRHRGLDLNVEARVMRGRSQPRPGEPKGGERMCAKHDLAEALAALGTDVANTPCRSKPATKGGQAEECEYAATCPYLRQMRDKAPGFLIAAHQYIPLTLDGLKADNIDLLIVDESFWQAMCREGKVDTSQFVLHRTPGEFSKAAFRKGESKEARDERLTEDAADHANLINKVRRILRQAQDDDRPLDLQAFRDAGFTPDICRWAASYEYGRLGKPTVTAGYESGRATKAHPRR